MSVSVSMSMSMSMVCNCNYISLFSDDPAEKAGKNESVLFKKIGPLIRAFGMSDTD